MEFVHNSVLLQESINGLNIQPNGIYIDGTLGGAGHSKKIVEKLDPTGKLVGIDRDEEAIEVSKKRLANYKNIIYVQDNHDNIKEILEKLKIKKVNGILLDLGVSSYQLDERQRGFSYLGNHTLDMRMDKNQKLTAKDIINTYTEQELNKILLEYGEEKFAKKIVKKIIEYRKQKEITTTQELVSIIEESIPKKKQKEGHPAKKTFQAIRIEVNNEIEPLYYTIRECIKCLEEKGRLCVITFHSLEDRAVKNAFIDAQGKCTCPSDLPYCICNYNSEGKIITKKPILPTKEEIEQNSRAKSAKLRIFEKK